jgi:hypothetical protein
MRRNVHEGEVSGTDELYRRTLEETVVFFADKSCVLYSFPADIVDVCVDAYYANIIRVWLEAVQGDVLADEDTDADAAHVESVKEGLDGPVDDFAPLLLLEFKDTLGHGRHYRVMSPLDVGEKLREALVVVVHLRRPVEVHLRIRVIP